MHIDSRAIIKLLQNATSVTQRDLALMRLEIKPLRNGLFIPAGCGGGGEAGEDNGGCTGVGEGVGLGAGLGEGVGLGEGDGDGLDPGDNDEAEDPESTETKSLAQEHKNNKMIVEKMIRTNDIPTPHLLSI